MVPIIIEFTLEERVVDVWIFVKLVQNCILEYEINGLEL
jgi:hypothetical protein